VGSNLSPAGDAFGPSAAGIAAAPSSVMTKLSHQEPTEICTRDGTGCFARGTLVRTPRGMFAIEQLIVGDDVLTLGKRVAQIVKVSHATAAELVRVHFSDGSTLACTPWHRFFDLRGDLYRAEQLGVHSAIRCYDNSIVHVDRLERIAGGPAFNLSLAREVAFFAGNKLVEAPHEARVLTARSLLARDSSPALARRDSSPAF
jgi:hypothetical protein